MLTLIIIIYNFCWFYVFFVCVLRGMCLYMCVIYIQAHNKNANMHTHTYIVQLIETNTQTHSVCIADRVSMQLVNKI